MSKWGLRWMACCSVLMFRIWNEMEQLGDNAFSDYYEPWWSATSEFTPDQNQSRPPAKVDLLSRVISSTIGKQVKTINFLASGVFHVASILVYEITFEFGDPIIIRIAFNFRDTERGRAAVSLKMKQETNILRLVKDQAPNVPIPAVFYSDPDPQNSIGAPYMLMEKLSGRSSGYSNLKGDDMEAFVESLAKVYVGVFDVTLPKIGSFLEVSSGGEPSMGPIIDEREEHPGGPFDTVQEYLDWLFSSTLNHPRNQSSSPDLDLQVLFPRLSNLAQLLLPPDPNKRIALLHLDPHERNILVEGTEVTGLIDWEAHGSLPSYLAAFYPPFLRRDGIFDERYMNTDEAEMSDKSNSSDGSVNDMNPDPLVSSEEAKHLREVFVQAAKKVNHEFVEALFEGEKLRQLIEWLTFAEWDGTWTWKGCDLWERDVRPVS
ncbi:hypothetical protein CPB84DRAFT_1828849 [Gymnopilus junonius]|uniref:Aminoglycoside phosphotransferase domain-containing protein n=1 Tax=Gymnopilus junonius TaxID=109634 RepID=A0A9P5NAP3_GYMJU|nr:hypothetical protein CPB84DRAFT_1828849 [Gymnopilus junonius]